MRLGANSPWQESKLKAYEILNERTFRRQPAKRAYVEAVFDLCKDDSLGLATIAVIMEKPDVPLKTDGAELPPHYQYLVERIHWYAVSKGLERHALIVFDSAIPKGICSFPSN